MTPTAGKFLESMNIPPDATWGMFDIDKIMVEFAKLHVTEALARASCNIDSEYCFAYSSERDHYDDIKKSILNAYPLEEIK